MPKISELPSVLTLDINDVAAFVSKDNQNVDQTMKVKVSEVATKVVNNIEYGSLNTSDKKVLGAINEVNGKAKENLSDLTDTTITTPSNADLLAYDSSTSKWVNTDLKGQASGSIATFNNGGDGIPCSVECDINPTQSGSGTPSPSNPRPISGVSNLDISVADGDMVVQHTHTLSLGETVYGGRLAYSNGEWSLVATYGIIDMGTINYQYVSPLASMGVFPFEITGRKLGGEFLSEQYQSFPHQTSWGQNDLTLIAINDYQQIRIMNSNCTTVAQLQAATSGCNLVYELETPVIIPITSSVRVKTLSGNNNIYHNGNGDISVNYFTDKADNIAELIKAFL